MIYTTGTVSTVSGSAIVKGTGTKFKNNNPAINIGMTILIKSGNTNIPYMIKSINSDTELVLAQPALATATNTAFSIHITEPDNNSDAARTMVAINSYVEYFLDAMNTWMTQTGQTKIEMPNGEIVTLDSIKKMQSDIANRADKSTAALQLFSGGVRAPYVDAIQGANYFGLRAFNNIPSFYAFFDGKGYNVNVPIKQGTMMLVGDYGVGTNRLVSENRFDDFGDGLSSGFYSYVNPKQVPDGVTSYGGVLSIKYDENNWQKLIFSNYGAYLHLQRCINGSRSTVQVMTKDMWTTDSNGFYKRASPIININSDGTFTTNDESEGATVTRVAQGEYLIESVLGFNSDAGWGGVDGGIEIPLDVNKQPLIWVNSKVNKDGSILVKTYHRTHSNAPEFARNGIDGYSDGDPIDIPDGRFISVRVQMPEQSIYNVRMREMEEAQKAEEERRQKEEEENQDTNKTPEVGN